MQGSYDKEERGCPACSEAGGEEDDRSQDRSQDRPDIEEESQSHLLQQPTTGPGYYDYRGPGPIFPGSSTGEGKKMIWDLVQGLHMHVSLVKLRWAL